MATHTDATPLSRVPSNYQALLDELGTGENPHSARTLKDHLIGTWAMLDEWGAAEPVAAAGLFHSIYGTISYRLQSTTFEDRARVAKRIGERAERLAWLFCVTDRSGFFFQLNAAEPTLWNFVANELIDVTQDELTDLIEIEVANLIEQIPVERATSRTVARFRQMRAGRRPTVSERSTDDGRVR